MAWRWLWPSRVVTVTRFVSGSPWTDTTLGNFRSSSWIIATHPWPWMLGTESVTRWIAAGRRPRRGTRRPQKEFRRTVVTLAAIAAIAQTGAMRPVVARGTPTPLNEKARERFWTVFR